MDEGIQDMYYLEDNLNVGNINLDEEINKKAEAYFTTAKKYVEEKKLKTCEEFLEDVLIHFKKEPFEYIIFMTIKIYCNLRLHNYRSVSNNLSLVGNLDGKNYKFQNFSLKYKKKRGSMIPFLLRLINSYYPYTLSLYFTSFDRLYLLILYYEKLFNECVNIIEKENHIADKGIDNMASFSYTFLRKKNILFHHVTITCYVLCDLLLKKNYIEQAIQLLKDKILIYDADHASTISLIGKFALLMGSFDIAESSFNSVQNLLQNCTDNAAVIKSVPTTSGGCITRVYSNNINHVKMNGTFFYLYLEEYAIALNELLLIHPTISEHTNINKEKDSNVSNNDNGSSIDNNVVSNYAIYCNNLAITYFLNNDLKKAIDILEQAIRDNYINSFPSLIKNLNYFYELAKTKNETVNEINDFIKNKLNEDHEVLFLIPKRS
ncbi:hypothetical protein MKS88_005752 [Plasmodium brasilianum]|uniref:Tetratricopeptide repeat protein n=2 Tax=Plasmodium (Plasmodium) TaxID=418103 RepID=A0A1A8WHC2_PLAMA|nr:conserved Plasmodium protein, unknown function [Plasmodium malariae]KAI4835069.1 hypothetical protein MKS88_005752 [Plasmodium brasilianum]SBS91189.1 conserved Plasmodium protein, unknown function [Plasmodium malariae]SCP03645.1 conserved Plasmodium protein, unknown function [Plasmodium malariae]